MHNLQELSHFVWELRFLAIASQTAHWRVFGPSSYSDHQLFGVVYEKLNELLDPLAERLTALAQFDDENLVCPLQQAQYVAIRMEEVMPELHSAFMDANLLAAFFYRQLLSVTRKMRDSSTMLRTTGELTFGLEDLLGSTAGELEVLVYFLERRSQVAIQPGKCS